MSSSDIKKDKVNITHRVKRKKINILLKELLYKNKPYFIEYIKFFIN